MSTEVPLEVDGFRGGISADGTYARVTVFNFEKDRLEHKFLMALRSGLREIGWGPPKAKPGWWLREMYRLPDGRWMIMFRYGRFGSMKYGKTMYELSVSVRSRD